MTMTGCQRSENAFSIKVGVTAFWNIMQMLLKGKSSITVKKPSLRPSTGNHIPDSMDWPEIKIEDMPPTALKENTEPKSIPIAANIIMDKRAAGISHKRLKDIRVGSKMQPTPIKINDWISPKGVIAAR